MVSSRKSIAVLIAAAVGALGFTAITRAGVSFGNFEDGTTDGFGNLTSSSGVVPFSGTAPTGTVIMPTSGSDTTNVLDLTAPGYNGGQSGGTDLGYDFVASGTSAAFLANDVLTFNWEVAPSSTSSGYSQLYAIVINAPGYGYHTIGGNSQTSDTNVTNQYPPYSGQLNTYSINYDSIKSQISANPGYIQFGITTNNGGGAPPDIYFDNFTLSSLSGASMWNVNSSGDWNVATNWNSGVPNAVGAEADLLSSITANHTLYTDIPITLGKLVFNNSSASYAVTGAVGSSLTLQTSSGSAVVDVQAGTHEINLPLILASNTTFQTDAASAQLTVGNPLTIDSGIALTTTGSGTVSYLSTITLNSGAKANIATSTVAQGLSLAAGANVILASSSGTKVVLQVTNLTDNLGGTINVSNGGLIVHGGTSLATVSSEVASGFSKGAWTGTGINSGAAASSPNHLTALGTIQATSAGTLDGATYSAGDVLVKYTYYGDTNLDGKVDASDYSRIDSGFVTHATGWANGDFNYDGVVNGSDYTLIDNAFNTQGAAISSIIATSTAEIATGSSAVPEPTSLLLAAGVATQVLSRRRRKV